MAAKKYYAVKKGKATGIFHTWEECRTSVEGYPGAEYKGFALLEEAEAYLGTAASGICSSDEKKQGRGRRKSRGTGGQNVEEAHSMEEEHSMEENHSMEEENSMKEDPPPGMLLAYVDGSYDNSLKKYAFGCVFILSDGTVETAYGNGDNEQSLRHRNVTGEMLGAMYAVKSAMLSGFRRVEIRYDYQGIEKWVTGEWKSKTEQIGRAHV